MQDGDLVDLDLKRPTDLYRRREAVARHDGEALEGMLGRKPRADAKTDGNEE